MKKAVFAADVVAVVGIAGVEEIFGHSHEDRLNASNPPPGVEIAPTAYPAVVEQASSLPKSVR